jgi:hypothetical protein
MLLEGETIRPSEVFCKVGQIRTIYNAIVIEVSFTQIAYAYIKEIVVIKLLPANIVIAISCPGINPQPELISTALPWLEIARLSVR